MDLKSEKNKIDLNNEEEETKHFNMLYVYSLYGF
jgi:hypothetical protein